MKPILLIISALLLVSGSCKKNKNPVDELPVETQTGANTFGCLVNGQVFKPGGAQLSGGSLSCNYQYINGGFYFRLSGVKGSGNGQSSVGVFTDSLSISEGMNYPLLVDEKGKSYAYYSDLANGNSQNTWFYETNLISKGELHIKKLDPVNQIVSGTFWFDAVNAGGQKVEVREGRFNVRYTR